MAAASIRGDQALCIVGASIPLGAVVAEVMVPSLLGISITVGAVAQIDLFIFGVIVGIICSGYNPLASRS